MALTGIDGVLFAAESIETARRFLSDWGLKEEECGDGCRFTTRDGTEVLVRLVQDPMLPPAMEPGPTLREVVWGIADKAALEALAQRLAPGGFERAGDALRVVDPNGLSHVFRVTKRRLVIADTQDVNGPGVIRRADRRSQIYDRALPISIGHVVLFVDDLAASLEFFLGRLGFVVSDSYPGYAAFLRARTPGNHHDAFILQRPGGPGLNHVAFTVSNIHEVFGGGLAMSRNGWETDIGPGRHPISSAYFWYLKSPFGGSFEYYADDDFCTQAWEPREFERTSANFAEWAVAGGIDGHTRRQLRAASPSASLSEKRNDE